MNLVTCQRPFANTSRNVNLENGARHRFAGQAVIRVVLPKARDEDASVCTRAFATGLRMLQEKQLLGWLRQASCMRVLNSSACTFANPVGQISHNCESQIG